MKHNELYLQDLARYGRGGIYTTWCLRRFHYLLRKYQTARYRILKVFLKLLYGNHCRKHGIEFSPAVPVGGGLYLYHPYCITVNSGAKLGRNVNLTKGVTIGQMNRGPKQGCPTIGNDVWIGSNATVVGKIQIGDDVMIAPNTFVNFDVPSHSIVIGNPAVIKYRENATEGYIERRIRFENE